MRFDDFPNLGMFQQLSKPVPYSANGKCSIIRQNNNWNKLCRYDQIRGHNKPVLLPTAQNEIYSAKKLGL